MRYLKYFLRVFAALAIFIAILFWVLSLTVKNGFEWFETYYMAYIIFGGLGAASIIYMFPSKNRLFGYIGTIFLIPVIIIAFVYGDIAIGVPFIVLFVAGLFLVFALFGIKKWDAGDNQKLGYKTYAQRKAEQEEKEKKELDLIQKTRQKEKNAAVTKAMAEAAKKAEEEFDAKNKK